MTLLALLACADLPEGWEDARPIEQFSQTACGDSPYEAYEPIVTATPEGEGTTFQWQNAHFRCSQDVEGFYKTDGARVAVLVQPIDMHPSSVAKCDCLYTLDFTVPGAQDGWEIWRRWDAINDPNDPVLIDASE